MTWKNRRLSDEVIRIACTIRSVKKLSDKQAWAASEVAGFVEAVANQERIHKGEAINLIDQEYQGSGLHRSVIDRCVRYDA